MFTGGGLRRFFDLVDDDYDGLPVHYRSGVVVLTEADLTCECGDPVDLPNSKARVFLACNKVLNGGATRCGAC